LFSNLLNAYEPTRATDEVAERLETMVGLVELKVEKQTQVRTIAVHPNQRVQDGKKCMIAPFEGEHIQD